ncbi:MAG TPA: hypothetical protein VN681_03565 [Stellaceae bacterium]|nr:hypothetical protein [Stellaceae bacterium]
MTAMMLFEEGRFLLSDPLAKYIPGFAGAKVGIERNRRPELVPAARDITINTFWVDPAEQLYAVMMTQAPHARVYMRALFRDMVYAAIAD